MWIIQVADIHIYAKLSQEINLSDHLGLMYEEIRNIIGDEKTIVVAICGDVTFKGNPKGYKPALNFFRSMINIFKYDIKFCLCPGNHDIVSNEDKDFISFNKFAWSLTQDGTSIFSRDETVVHKSINDIDIILVNSAHHGDHTYGLIDISKMDVVLRASSSANKLILVHHHAVPVDINDRSTIANAYKFLTLSSYYNVKAILHGHRHEQNILNFGKNNCRLIGAGSLLYSDKMNINNQFNLIRFDNGSVKEAYSYRFIADLHHKGKIGGFSRETITEY